MHYSNEKLDIIWNITQICMWDCGVCCVDAVHVSSKNKLITIKSKNFNKIEQIKHDGKLNIFDQVLKKRVDEGYELSLAKKLQVLENLRGYNVKIDFSGGDPLAISSTKEVMKRASYLFGKNNITLTATGAGLARVDVDEISPLIGELNFTYDSSDFFIKENRPKGYAYSNLKKASKFAKVNVKIRGETPLTIDNIDKNNLTRIYLDLHEANVSTHLIMRLFPSGRGLLLQDKIPSKLQYINAIDLLYELEAKYIYPKIKLQCALKFLDKTRILKENPCDMVTKSFGLMPNGALLASPWAINNIGAPISDTWVLGNLSLTKLSDILSTEKVNNFIKKADDNFGHCKIHAFFNRGSDKENIIFSKSDPLYSD